MATYQNGSWKGFGLATDQRRTGYNPHTKNDFVQDFPNKVANDWKQYWPDATDGRHFITNEPGYYKTWTRDTLIPDGSGRNWPNWTLETDPSKWSSQYPANKTTKKKYWVAYNNKTNKWINAIGSTKDEAKKAAGDQDGQIKVKSVEVDVSTNPPTYKDGSGQTWEGFDKFLQGQRDPTENPITDGGRSGLKAALQGQRKILYDNRDANQADLNSRVAAMNQWNHDNVRVPAAKYAEIHTEQGAKWRDQEAKAWNEGLDAPDGPRQQAADSANEAGDQMYTRNNELNKWSEGAISWAKGTTTGLYTSNRDQIFSPAGQAAGLDNLVRQGIITQSERNSYLNGLKTAYGAYYVEDRIGGPEAIWDGTRDGGTYDLIGQFDKDFYLKEYGDSRGLKNAWENATKYGDASNIYDPNHDLDVTARYGSLDNYAWYDYSNGGQADGARGSKSKKTKAANKYSESFDDLTDAEQQAIRDGIFGLTGANETIDWAEDILDPLADETASFLEGKVAGIFSDKDLEQQDKFKGLAQDVLKTTIDELRKQQQNEREMDVFRGLPGFNEIYGSNKQLVNSLLGDSGIGGYLGMMGVDTRDMAKDLEKGFEDITGIKTSNAEYNWQKWMDETLQPYYEGLEEIEGERLDEDGNKITYDLTSEEGKQFITKFISDYITPRFNMSKSMSEFVSYLDTLDEDEQNIFQTQTAMNKLKQTAEISAKAQFNALKESGDKSKFDWEYYFDPTTTLEGVSEEDLEKNYMNVAETKKKYEAQKAAVNKDWAAAKADGKSKEGIPAHSSNYNWEQWAYFYGVDINDKKQFAKLHYQVAGQGKYDPAKDIVSYSTVNEYFNDVLLPMVAEEKISLDDAAFMQFVTPEEFASALLEGIDPTENEEEWKKVLEQFGIDDLDASLDEVKQYIKEAFETGEAQAIREGIKYLNEKKEDINQENLGVDYIERDPIAILGEKGAIEVGSQAWKDLMISYNFDPNLNYEEATNALLDKEDIDADTTNPLYEIFRGNGYEGTEDQFYEQFFPDASDEELADLNFVGRALQGGMSLEGISDDPFMAMSQFEEFLGGTEGDLYGIEDEDAGDNDNTSYFDLFPEEKDYASSTGRGIIDSWTGGLFG